MQEVGQSSGLASARGDERQVEREAADGRGHAVFKAEDGRVRSDDCLPGCCVSDQSTVIVPPSTDMPLARRCYAVAKFGRRRTQ